VKYAYGDGKPLFNCFDVAVVVVVVVVVVVAVVLC
jgi:hypothetical protein